MRPTDLIDQIRNDVYDIMAWSYDQATQQGCSMLYYEAVKLAKRIMKILDDERTYQDFRLAARLLLTHLKKLDEIIAMFDINKQKEGH